MHPADRKSKTGSRLSPIVGIVETGWRVRSDVFQQARGQGDLVKAVLYNNINLSIKKLALPMTSLNIGSSCLNI
jgi:hypothetical protein